MYEIDDMLEVYTGVLTEAREILGSADIINSIEEWIEKRWYKSFLEDGYPEEPSFLPLIRHDKKDVEYEADKLGLALYIYRNVVENLSENHKTYCIYIETEFDPVYTTWDYIIEQNGGNNTVISLN